MRRAFAALVVAMASTASAQEAVVYPVILPDVASQVELGILESAYGPAMGATALPHKCYYYGDGGSLLSVSDEFLSLYEARGFTLRTLCLGLVSGVAFHPETGAALATIQAVNVEEATAPDYFGEPGPVGPVTTLQLPSCFRRGVPLSDCAFRYDPFSGERLSADRTEGVAAQGAAALTAGKRALASGRYAAPCPDGEIPNAMIFKGSEWVGERTPEEKEACYAEQATEKEPYIKGYFLREYHAEEYWPAMIPYGGFIDFSPAHPEGFAYALFADGAAGPSHEMGSDVIQITGKDRSNSAVIESLKIAISGD